MIEELEYSAVDEDDRDRAVATLVSAFTDDPVERWLYPEESQYLAHFPAFVEAFGGGAIEQRTAWKLGECAAVALWFGPGSEPDGEAIAAVLCASVSPGLHADMFAVLDQMDAAHPRDPVWYLPWFGVDRALQGNGLGGQLMAECLRIVDASGLPAYLETPNPRTVGFYGRHGFDVTGVAQAGACPPVTLMLRPPMPA
jgi:ribosomal protein S18 acetylase RimI-like enzyme